MITIHHCAQEQFVWLNIGQIWAPYLIYCHKHTAQGPISNWRRIVTFLRGAVEQAHAALFFIYKGLKRLNHTAFRSIGRRVIEAAARRQVRSTCTYPVSVRLGWLQHCPMTWGYRVSALEGYIYTSLLWHLGHRHCNAVLHDTMSSTTQLYSEIDLLLSNPWLLGQCIVRASAVVVWAHMSPFDSMRASAVVEWSSHAGLHKWPW